MVGNACRMLMGTCYAQVGKATPRRSPLAASLDRMKLKLKLRLELKLKLKASKQIKAKGIRT